MTLPQELARHGTWALGGTAVNISTYEKGKAGLLVNARH